MKIFFSFTILFFLFLGINPVLGQETYNLPPNSDYEKAVIGLKNFRKKNVEELHIENDSIYFQQESKQFAMHLDEINYIRVHEGSRAKNGAIIGGATMLIISLGAILQVQ
ncbi:MAG: hypothetical protein OEW75_19305, partial [Cyclobacteriaceae bacterium]|nr:hypothetical protein [Cyclobacteriaceae bacterium]